jgi:hypothetical protein
MRAYWKDARPPGPRLFPGRDLSKPISRVAIHKALCKAASGEAARSIIPTAAAVVHGATFVVST